MKSYKVSHLWYFIRTYVDGCINGLPSLVGYRSFFDLVGGGQLGQNCHIGSYKDIHLILCTLIYSLL